MRSLPEVPKLSLNFKLETTGLSFRKSSLDIRHAMAAAGKNPQRFPEANLDDPSARSVNVAKYLSLYP